MTVIINIDKNNKKYYSSNTHYSGIFPDEELKMAEELNKLIKTKIDAYVIKVGLRSIKKDKVLYYWEIGKILRNIFSSSGLVLGDEKDLFFKNVRLHLNKDIFPDNDPSRNRNIPEQFFRLSGFSKEIIEKVKWTTWSYLFDSPVLSRIKNFDTWFSKNLTASSLSFDQAFSRLWFQSINVLFKNVRTDDWPNETLLNLIDSLFELCSKIVELGFKPGEKITLELLKKILGEKKKEFILLKSGAITKEDYLGNILSEFKKRHKNE